jgi:hypothetical protein
MIARPAARVIARPAARVIARPAARVIARPAARVIARPAARVTGRGIGAGWPGRGLPATEKAGELSATHAASQATFLQLAMSSAPDWPSEWHS